MNTAMVYWANALFSEADRDFNSRCVALLRSEGFCVYLPQEAAVNHSKEPTDEEIFEVDTEAVLKSRVIVACLDQESIDSGVACEIGIAFASKIPVIGLYTDIRQHRRGPNRMYKNPYLLGAIRANGIIVSNIQEVLDKLVTYIQV